MQTSISFILINYYTNIAPLDMADGDQYGNIGYQAPLDFLLKQRITSLEPIIYATSTDLQPLLQKTIELAASIDAVIVDSVPVTFSSSIDAVLFINAPSAVLDLNLAKNISTSASMDIILAVRGQVDSSIDLLLSTKKIRITNIDFKLQKQQNIACSIDIQLELLAIYSSLDMVTTPEIIGERDIYNFSALIHNLEDRTTSITNTKYSAATITPNIIEDVTIQRILDKETQI